MFCGSGGNVVRRIAFKCITKQPQNGDNKSYSRIQRGITAPLNRAQQGQRAYNRLTKNQPTTRIIKPADLRKRGNNSRSLRVEVRLEQPYRNTEGQGFGDFPRVPNTLHRRFKARCALLSLYGGNDRKAAKRLMLIR